MTRVDIKIALGRVVLHAPIYIGGLGSCPLECQLEHIECITCIGYQ